MKRAFVDTTTGKTYQMSVSTVNTSDTDPLYKVQGAWLTEKALARYDVVPVEKKIDPKLLFNSQPPVFGGFLWVLVVSFHPCRLPSNPCLVVVSDLTKCFNGHV